jgi:PTS system N-acetylglucosamine-specific IIC component
MFLAPALFAVHAVLTGVAMAAMDALGVRLGFGFSAGLFDYVLNFSKATQPWLLLPIGLAYAGVYYGVFRWAIERFDLKTPGREPADAPVAATAAAPTAGGFVEALGGAANLLEVDACTTRLRLKVADLARVDEARLRALGAKGIVRPGGQALQVVLGPQADQVAADLRTQLRAAGSGPAEALAALLAGAGVRRIEARDRRLLVELARPLDLAPAAFQQAGARGAWISGERLHLILGADAADIGRRLATALHI